MGLRRLVMAGGLVLALGAQGARACSDETDLQMFGALQVAQIRPGAGRTHFYKSTCDAGLKGFEACRKSAYVMPGDVVLIGDVNDATACASFVDSKGRITSGLIKNDRVQTVRGGDTTSATAFVGRWVREEAEITVTRRGDGLAFSGDATYGAKDPSRVKRGAVNMGTFAFSAKADSNRLSVALTGAGDVAQPQSAATATDCQLDMIAMGPYLVVRDNMQCGGMNVSFTGIYRKR